jgi:hypothetical protein
MDFSKRVDCYGNSFYGKEEGRPYSFVQLVYKFLISPTSGFTNRIGNLNLAFEKAISVK